MGDFGVEGPGVLEVLVPKLINGVADELGCGMLCCFVGAEVADQDGMCVFVRMAEASWGMAG